MKVVHIANYFLPEFGYQEHYLAKKQAEMGHEVHVITSNRAYAAHEEYRIFSEYYPDRILPVGSSKRDGYFVHRLHGYIEKNMQILMHGLIPKLESLSPDIVVMHGFTRYETFRVCTWKLLKKKRFKLLVDDHSLYAGYNPKLYRRIYHSSFSFVFRHVLSRAVDRVIPVSRETARLLNDLFDVPNETMTVLPIGTDCDRFTYSEKGRLQVRADLNIPKDACVLAYIGKIVPERGVHLAFRRALNELKTRPNFYFIAVGSGFKSDYAKKIIDDAKGEGVADRVIFHPHVEHEKLKDFYSAADIAIWALQETMGSLEAASCGLPLILGNSEIAKERLAAGNGFNCKSAEEMSSALGRLIENPQLRKEMGLKGAQFMRQEFNWSAIAKRFLEVQ